MTHDPQTHAHAEQASPATGLDAIDHIAISVQEIPRAVEWYRGHFQCELLYQDESWAMLGFGNIKLALVIPGQHPPHIGFISPLAEQYGELKTHRDGSRSIYLPDSEGNVIEILAPYTIPPRTT